MSFAQVKVKNGKLLQLEKTAEGFKITGDFFCYPESVIEEMEKALTQNDTEMLKNLFDENDVIGFGYDDLLGLREHVI